MLKLLILDCVAASPSKFLFRTDTRYRPELRQAGGCSSNNGTQGASDTCIPVPPTVSATNDAYLLAEQPKSPCTELHDASLQHTELYNTSLQHTELYNTKQHLCIPNWLNAPLLSCCPGHCLTRANASSTTTLMRILQLLCLVKSACR
jgi:hypothetical protein